MKFRVTILPREGARYSQRFSYRDDAERVAMLAMRRGALVYVEPIGWATERRAA